MNEPKPKSEAKTSASEDPNKSAADVPSLKSRAEAAEKACEEFKDLAQRAQADFENYQKRYQRELALERKFAQAPLAKDLLPALDNLERAMEAAQKAAEQGPLVQGVSMVQSMLLDALRRHGVTRIEALGKPFDHDVHEAIMQVPSADKPPATVVMVMEQGYMIHDRVLRPARVAVSVKPGSEIEKAP
jgi:molecular chaperone GrpE